MLCSTLRLDNATACALEVSTTTRTARSDAPRGVRAVALTGAARPLEVDFGSVAPSGAFLSAGTATVPARGEAYAPIECSSCPLARLRPAPLEVTRHPGTGFRYAKV